jgi:hypothetical protein
MNINPDHVNLEKGGWKNILSFRTVEKNVLVEIYGRPLQKPNSGEFVMVRKGLLPLGMNSISKVYKNEKNVWGKSNIECDSLFEGRIIKKNPPSFKYCDLCMAIGDYFKQNGPLFTPIPSVSYCLSKVCPDTVFKLDGIAYSYCDEIPFFCRFSKGKIDIPRDYKIGRNITISHQIEIVFKKPEEGE